MKLAMVLLMTVNPGFERQIFYAGSAEEDHVIEKAHNRCRKLDVDIEVDGGINPETVKEVVAAGANVLVAGSAIFYSKNYAAA